MVDVNDGKYTGKMTPEQVIDQYQYRAGIHMSYIKLLEEQPNAGWEVYGTKQWHNWAINGYMEGIRHLENYIAGCCPAKEDKVEKKHWYESKTLWVNLIALAGIILNSQYGIELDAETQAVFATSILAIVNIVLRIVTKKPIGG